MGKKDPNAPKKALSAYFLFANSVRQEIRDENPDFKMTEVTKEAGRRWGEMDDDDKQEFKDKAAELKEEYEEKMKEYLANKEDDDEDEEEEKPKRKRGGKAKKDPNAPKKPLTAYFLFANSVRQEIRDENPDFKMTEVTKETGRRWGELDEDDKQEFKDKHLELKAEYEEKMKEYLANKEDDDEDEEEEKPKKKRSRKAKKVEEEEEDEDEDEDEE
eukprot:TRINITY_DN874_c0_g1_i1.p1 TRINITY_DN874_c0_g1~~TRINITY_DN874_c0_g1_i1.p1  ORF type:complete len:228 (+),score=150.90 TRINITY_DN874_c0_g1_i1:39-686(+)